MKRLISQAAFFFFLAFAGSFLQAQGGDRETLVEDPVTLLGWTLREAYAGLGVPLSVLPVRGDEDWQDDVVFDYGNGLSLFWYRDRVWQVRFDSRYRGEFWGLKIGLSPEEVSAVLGRPRDSADAYSPGGDSPGGNSPGGDFSEGTQGEEAWEVYFLPGHDFPLRLQVFYRDNQGIDYYLYRGDF